MNTYSISEKDFADEVSKQIFAARKDFYQTGDWSKLLLLVAKLHNHTVLKMQAINNEFIEELNGINRKIVIFGAGKNGKSTFYALKKYPLRNEVVAFLDNNPQKQKMSFCGKQVVSMEEIINHKDDYFILIPIGKNAESMRLDLQEAGFGTKHTKIVPLKFRLHSNIETRDDVEEILFAKKNKLTIYGTGHLEFLLLFLLQKSGIDIDFVMTDIAEEKQFHDVMVKSLDAVKTLSSDYNVIVFNGIAKEKLMDMGIAKKQILHLVDMDFLQYFDKEIVHYEPAEEEIFIDGGALNLDTAREFLCWGGALKRVYAFEPDPANLRLCKKHMEENVDMQKAVTLIPKGLWSDDAVLTFNAVDVSGASYIAETNCPNVELHKMNVDNQIEIACTSVDNVLQGEKATFIKMDIEGSELEALKGAANTIRKWRPTLAISVYHKPEDIVAIPSYIKSLVPEYDLYLRCYHEDHTETVLYAIYRRE